MVERLTCKRPHLELFTSEKRLYTFVCEFTHLHPSETQNRRQNCQCEPSGALMILSFLLCSSLPFTQFNTANEDLKAFRGKQEYQELFSVSNETKTGKYTSLFATGRHEVRKTPKRKFFKTPVRYTVNGDSFYNLQMITLELVLSGDVELNPGDGPDGSLETDIRQLELPDKGLRIGQWNVNRLTDAKLEQISLLLNTCQNIDILFLIETFLKPSNPDSVLNIPGYSLFRKDRAGVTGNLAPPKIWPPRAKFPRKFGPPGPYFLGNMAPSSEIWPPPLKSYSLFYL